MELLFVHAHHLEFEVTTTAGEDIAETEGVPMEGRLEDCVVVFASIERADETDPDAVVANAADEVRDVADQLNTRKVALYPSVHLSDDLAGPDSAKTVFQNLERELDADFEVLRAPVGWHTAVEVSSKGHPLSELSRRVTPEREAAGDADAPECAPSEWRLLFPDGDARNPVEVTDEDRASEDDRVGDDLRALVEAEVEGRPVDGSERPPLVELAREQGFADYDDTGGRDGFDDADGLSDVDSLANADGHADADGLRWLPRGNLVRDTLWGYAKERLIDHGAMPIGTRATTNFESGVGAFPILRDGDLSERNLPLRIYEQSGDSGQQSATTPTMSTATRDVEQAKAELRGLAKLVLDIGEELGLNYVPTIRLTRQFHDGNEAWVESLITDLATPALLEILPERREDWSVRVDFAAVGGRGRPIETATLRLDVERDERVGVTNDADENTDMESCHLAVLHCSPFGSVESVLTALLERAGQLEPPRLPTGLSPTQVRFVPIEATHVEYCDALADDLESAGVRADVDDRDESVGERIANAEADWVPYYAVVGDRELEFDGDGLKVTIRAEGDERAMCLETLQATVLDEVTDLPRTQRYLPEHVSRHPNFIE